MMMTCGHANRSMCGPECFAVPPDPSLTGAPTTVAIATGPSHTVTAMSYGPSTPADWVVDVKITRVMLLRLTQATSREGIRWKGSPPGVTSIELDVKLTLAEDVSDIDTKRALADVLTEDVPYRYEHGWNVEECAYEPGTNAWIGWVVGNADRIEMAPGVMLMDVAASVRAAWLERKIMTREEIVVLRKKKGRR